MVDPQDPGTLALPLTFKRSRGRPRKPNALTPAERARRYRARKKTLSIHAVSLAVHSDVVRERDHALSQVRQLRGELERLLQQLQS
ncbi:MULTISPECIES: hypothetical protein [Dyella]|uniref:hypothetical protein n=1 Tax=Dyella TaxID=231454 RepID=UPI000C865C5F|nr:MULTISPECIES: hypothetical protein [Dyella]MDR3443859.1 hypothetical protein [Dyella sp.]PMQ03107.1 hypothetical protein DyAD56_20505 [Dyella sp. AD56]ULU23583.1 hypothetical protein DYST_00481 [Dyella terrae]